MQRLFDTISLLNTRPWRISRIELMSDQNRNQLEQHWASLAALLGLPPEPTPPPTPPPPAPTEAPAPVASEPEPEPAPPEEPAVAEALPTRGRRRRSNTEEESPAGLAPTTDA